MHITDAQLLEWNRKGLIPGPEEDEALYKERVEHCLNVRQELQLDPSLIEKESLEVIKEPLETTRNLYDITPDWIPVVYGNKYLMPWHGGCAWIFQMRDNGPLSAFIQLRKSFLRSRTYLGFYERNELITHELSHACRMAFQEPAFEEVLAYNFSSRSFTRLLGPIVESSIESAVFMLALALIIGVEWISIIYGLEGDGSLLLGLSALPHAIVIYWSLRLWRKHTLFKKCISQLMKIVSELSKARGIVYRLTDAEIRTFASMHETEIISYANEQREHSLRWRAIHLAYFSTL